MRKETLKSRKCRVLYKINPRSNTLRHTVIKLTKIKHKEKNTKSNKGKTTNNIQGNAHFS